MKRVINGLFVGLGFFFLGLGAVGVALPLLPATPFLILAAICFAKGSKKFHQWFTQTGLYLKYVEPAVTKKEMEKTAKKKTMLTLAIIFTISFLWVPVWQAKVVIALVALFHFYYFTFKIKTALVPVDLERKRQEEADMLRDMIHIYCNGHHHTQNQGLCDICSGLQQYAVKRTEKCPFMETKTFCSVCKVHCYSSERRDQIKQVMRYAGPRMLFKNPTAAIRHANLSLKNKGGRGDVS